MKKLRLQITGIVLLAAAVAIPTQAMAQWSLGVSYQIRQEAPKYGFGVRIEREILQKLPLLDLGLRAHFAYFNQENNVSRQDFTISDKIVYYDYGVAGYAGVSLGLIKPYVGLGIGASTIDFVKEDGTEINESTFFWNGFVGAEVSIIPKIHPFIEYRFQPGDDYDDAIDNALNDVFDSNGRIIIGLSIAF